MKLYSVKESLEQEIQKSEKEQQIERLRALRSVHTMIRREERRKKRASLTNNMLLCLLINAAEERQESIAIYQKQGLTKLAQLEKEELAVIQAYLPPQMSAEAIGKIVAQIIRSLNVRSMEDANRVISIAKEEIGNRSTGRTIAKIVRAQLKQFS